MNNRKRVTVKVVEAGKPVDLDEVTKKYVAALAKDPSYIVALTDELVENTMDASAAAEAAKRSRQEIIDYVNDLRGANTPLFDNKII